MEIIPVIYILDGQCVALYKGDYNQKEVYHVSPVEKAKQFAREGADKLYIADLNGKQENALIQKDIMKEIIDAVDVPVWLEDGFANPEEIRQAMDMGAAKVVIRSPKLEFVKGIIDKFGAEKIIIQIHANRSELINGRVKKNADDFEDVVDYAEKLVPLGVKTIIYKDKRSEGILTNPNYDEIDRLFLTVGDNLKIYSSGGTSEPHHIKLLKKIGAAGVLIGKAFFERGLLSISKAKEAAEA